MFGNMTKEGSERALVSLREQFGMPNQDERQMNVAVLRGDAFSPSQRADELMSIALVEVSFPSMGVEDRKSVV